MAGAVRSSALLDGLERDALHVEDVRHALAELQRRCDREGIPLAVFGDLAMRQHGCTRFTEDIDIVTTADGLAAIHERLIRAARARPPQEAS